MASPPPRKPASRIRRTLARVLDGLEWLLAVTAIGGAAGALAWLLRHYG